MDSHKQNQSYQYFQPIRDFADWSGNIIPFTGKICQRMQTNLKIE